MQSFLVFVLCLVCAAAAAHENGDTVVVIAESGVELKASEEFVSRCMRGMPVRVVEVDGERLRVASDNKVGWIQGGDVAAASEALTMFTAGIDKNPNASDYLARARVKFAEKDREGAIEDVSVAIGLDPQNAVAYSYRARLWLNRRDYDRAIADCDNAIQLDPTLAPAYKHRGEAKYKNKRAFAAIEDYDAANRLDPTDANCFHCRGVAGLENRNGEEAVRDLTEAIRLGDDSALVYRNRGIGHHMLRNYGEALSDFKESIVRDPSDSWAHYLAAWIYATCPDEKWRDGKQGVELALKACELSEGNVVLQFNTLAAAYAEAGQFEDAIRTQEQVIRQLLKLQRGSFEETLQLYHQGKAYRESP